MHRRRFLHWATAAAGLGIASPFAWAIGDASRLAIALLTYQAPGDNPRPGALRRLLLEVEKRTSIIIDPEVAQVAPNHSDLFASPFLVWAGDQFFPPLPEDHIANLALFLKAGGFVLIDNNEAPESTGFDQAIRREISRLAPGQNLQSIDSNHVIFKSFYLLDQCHGRIERHSELLGLVDHERIMLAYCQNDLQGAWARDAFGNEVFEVVPGGARQRERSFRFGINCLMYALCLDYKADQVHIPFILKRRQWRLD